VRTTATEWNRAQRPGSSVIVKLDDGSLWETKTRSEAWTLDSGHVIVLLMGRTGGYAIERYPSGGEAVSRWCERRPELEARRGELERAATDLIKRSEPERIEPVERKRVVSASGGSISRPDCEPCGDERLS
jgi:hypothetical protein